MAEGAEQRTDNDGRRYTSLYYTLFFTFNFCIRQHDAEYYENEKDHDTINHEIGQD